MFTESMISSVTENLKVVKFIDDVFQKFDVDNSGFLSKMEFAPAINAILNKLGVQSCCIEDMIDIFDLLDANGDETISREQFTVFIGVINFIIEKHGKNAIKDDLSWLKESLQ